jgi:hypothetical protein
MNLSLELSRKSHAAVEERQTRGLQVAVSERTCGFESHQPHVISPARLP